MHAGWTYLPQVTACTSLAFMLRRDMQHAWDRTAFLVERQAQQTS